MRAIAERTLLAQAAAAQTDGRLARQVPFLTVGIFQDDVAFYAQRTVGANSDVNWCFCHRKPPKIETAAGKYWNQLSLSPVFLHTHRSGFLSSLHKET